MTILPNTAKSNWEGLRDLNREDSRPFYAQMAEIIEGFIVSHTLPAGSPLPTENDLMQRFGMSRTTVRQAVQRLEDRGLVQKIQGKGTFVTASKRKSLVTAFRSIEPGLARQGLTVTNIVLDRVDGRPPQWAVDIGFPAKAPVRIFKRLKTVEGRPLAHEVRVLQKDVADVITDDDLTKRPFYDALETKSESKIQHITYSISSTVASAEVAEEMQIDSGSPLLVRVGLYYNLSGRPIMAGKVLLMAERIELRFEFDRRDDNWGIIFI